MKKILLILGCSIIMLATYGQSIQLIEHVAKPGTIKKMVPQNGKGIWIIHDQGIRLYEPVKKTSADFSKTNTGEKLPLISHFIIQKNKTYCASTTRLFSLLTSGQWKEIKRPGGQLIYALAMQGNDLLVMDKNDIFRLNDKDTIWQKPVNYIRTTDRTGAPSKYFLYASGRYYFYNKGYAFYCLDTTTKRETVLSNTIVHESGVEAGKGVWMKYYASVSFLPEHVGDNPKLLTFNDAALFNNTGRNKTVIAGTMLQISDKGQALLIGKDTTLTLTTTSSLLNGNAIVAEKSTVVAAPVDITNPAAIYTGTLYEASTEGLTRYSGRKKEMLNQSLLKSSKIDAYSRLMPDGKLYTKEKNRIWIADGKAPVTSVTLLAGYIQDIASNGKDIYALAEDSLFKLTAPGKFTPIAKMEYRVSAIAFDDKGVIWMGGSKGLVKYEKGKQIFIPSEEIKNYPYKSFASFTFLKDGTAYISMDQEYIYKDKQMTAITGSKGLGYTHYSDPDGIVYSAGIGSFYRYKDNNSTELVKLIAEKYPELTAAYVQSISQDTKGRIWALVSSRTKNGLVIFEKGEPVHFITDNLTLPNPYSSKIFFKKTGELLIIDEQTGWYWYKTVN